MARHSPRAVIVAAAVKDAILALGERIFGKPPQPSQPIPVRISTGVRSGRR